MGVLIQCYVIYHTALHNAHGIVIYFETLQGERGLNGREVTLWDGVRLVDDGCYTKIVRD